MESITEDDIQKIRKETIDSLRMHFVYNSMNAIRYYIRKNPEKAYAMTSDLATFLRGNVEKTLEQGSVSVKQELQFAHAYAQLEASQRDLLEIQWQVKLTDGSVPSGSIYKAIMKLIKSHVVDCMEERTLVVQSSDEGDAVCILIPQTGALAVIPVLDEVKTV